jgi:hypothetical protein
MKIYKFSESKFPINALVWASSEGNARLLYSKEVKEITNIYSISTPIDLDEYYNLLFKFYSDEDLSEGEINISAMYLIEYTVRSKESVVILTWGNKLDK